MNDIIQSMQNYIDSNGLSQAEFARKMGYQRGYFWKMMKGEKPITKKLKDNLIEHGIIEPSSEEAPYVAITYRPDVKLSAGYGCYPINEESETVLIDKKLLISDKGLAINPNYCEIVKVSGDSMLPEYQDGDRVIIDKSITQFLDGHIFAFRLNEQLYIKRINLLPNKIKCISINPDYDTFYLETSENFDVLGLILPRIRF